jgi:predicted RNA-binding Zn-ribbon protein involved in translation (DUF1610 family)
MFRRRKVPQPANPRNGFSPPFPTRTESQTPNAVQYGQVGEGAPSNLEVPSQQEAHKDDFVTLTCSSCGERLQVRDDIDRFACDSCGNEHLVQRQGGTVFLAATSTVPVPDSQQISGSVDTTDAELAVVRLTNEVESLNLRYNELSKQSNHAWLAPNLLEYLSPYLAFILPIVLLVAIAVLLPDGKVDSTFSATDWMICGLFLLVPTTFIGGFVLLARLRNKRLQQTNEIKNRELTVVRTLLQEKQLLLVKNRQIVDA